VPEENFWILWCKVRLTEADTPTIRLGDTPSRLTSAHLHYLPDKLKTELMPYVRRKCVCIYLLGIHFLTITTTVVFLSKLLNATSKLCSTSAHSTFWILHKDAPHKFIVTLTFYASTL